MNNNLRSGLIVFAWLVALVPSSVVAQTDDSLSLITPDAVAMVSLQPALIAKSPSMQRAPLEVITAAGLEYTGIDPLKIERIDLISGLPIPGPGGIPIALSITNSEAIDMKALSPFLPAGPVQEKGVDLWSIPGTPDFFMALKNNRQAIIGPKAQVLRLIKTTPGDGELRQLVKNLGPGAAFQLVVALEPLRDLLVQSAQSPVLGAIPGLGPDLEVLARTARQVAVRFDAGDKPKVTYMIEGTTPSDTTELAKAMKNLIRLGMKLGLSVAEQQLSVKPGQTPMATVAYLKRLSAEIESHLDFQPDGNRLAVSLEGQTVMVAQVGVVAGLLLPAVQASRQAARRVSDLNNMKQILLALHNYESVYRALPNNFGPNPKATKANLSWRVHLLPYLEQAELYNEFHLDEPWDSPHNIKLVERMPAVYRDPSSKAQAGLTVYQMPSGKDMVMEADKRLRFVNVIDGLSNTIALVTTDDAAAVAWTKPQDIDPIEQRESISVKLDRIVVGMLDGSVTQISNEIPTDALELMMLINDENEIERKYFK